MMDLYRGIGGFLKKNIVMAAVPSFSTRISSAARMVDSRWAIRMLVREWMMGSMASWILLSEMESRAEVASQR